MNDNEKTLKVDDDEKNCKIPVSRKKPIQCSKHSRENSHTSNVAECLHFGSRAVEDTDLHVSTAVKKRLSCTPTKKVTPIHQSGKKIHADKHCAEQIENTVCKAVRNPRSHSKHEKKYSKLLVPDEKLSASVSRKHQPALKPDRDTVINDLTGNICGKTQFKTNKKKSISKITEALCKTISPSAKRSTQRGYRERYWYSKREGTSQTVSNEADKVDQSQGTQRTRKYSDKVNDKEKTKLNSKRINGNTVEDLEKIKETKKVNPQKTVGTKDTLCKNTIDNGNDVKSNFEDNGAARTRIFKSQKSSKVDENSSHRMDSTHEEEDKCSRKKLRSKSSLSSGKQNETSNSIAYYCEQNSIDSSCKDKERKIISLHSGDLIRPELSIDSNQYQESGKPCVKLVGIATSNNVSSTTSRKLSSEDMVPQDAEIVLSKRNASIFSEDSEVCRDKNVPIIRDDKELVTEATVILDHDNNEMKKSLTISKIPAAVAQDEIRCHTNLINYGYHSDQQYCKRSNKQRQKHMPDEAEELIKADGNEKMIDDNAKYDLMKALIQPAAEVHGFKNTDDNHISKLLTSERRSECVLTNRDEGLQDCYVNSWSQGNMITDTLDKMNSVNQSRDNTENIKGFETWKPHTDVSQLNKPLSNTSEYIAMKLKLKGCKHTKKYRHFKHEEKNMCCNMAAYIERMVSNERKYQEFEKNGNSEREEVKIIIDENSPETSKIRIVNDRSSVSIVCHSLGRTSSSNDEKINAMVKAAESSGGESSGYKSFHNNSNTRHVDASRIEIKLKDKHDQIEHSAIITSHNPKTAQIRHYNSSTYSSHSKTLVKAGCNKDKSSSLKNSSDFLRVHNSVNRFDGQVGEDLNCQQNVDNKNSERRNTKIEYSSYDAKNYLSTFTNCMDVYLPCEIIAYQFEEKKRDKILHFDNKELAEKDVDDAELHIGRYLSDNKLDVKDESSEGDESSEQLGSVKDLTTAEDEVTVLKEPDDLKYESFEFVVTERSLQPDNSRTRIDSTDILAVPAQYKIVTSKLNIESEGITESSETPIKASNLEFTMEDNASTTAVKSSIDNIRTSRSYTTSPPVPQKLTNDTNGRLETYEAKPLGRYDTKNVASDDANAVHELWTNQKSAVDSTDNDSQLSKKSRCRKYCPKKNDTNKLRFNIFRKLKSTASEKLIHVPPDQLPKPPPSFLETSAPSQSTIYSSTTNSNASELDIPSNPQTSATSIPHTNSLTKPTPDTAPVHYARRTYTGSVSNESIDHSRFQTNGSTAKHEVAETNLKSSIASLSDQRSLVKFEESRSTAPQSTLAVPPSTSAVPPPASALPPPYPFCCPLVPYMMQYWQNEHQPPPASAVPLRDSHWKPTLNVPRGSEPPPPGMVPIPWFPPMMPMNSPSPIGEMDSRKFNALSGQPPPDWLMMPRGYAPCLPCSRTPESHLSKRHYSTYEDDEPGLEYSDSKQDQRKKRVSNKLFKIFRRKNRANTVTLDEDDGKGRYRQSRIDNRLNSLQVAQNDQQQFDDQSIWESPDIAGIVTPEEIGRCFRRGFRADGLTLSGEDYLCTKAPSDPASGQEDVFNFSDHDTPLDFLLALGFSVDEATAAIRDDEVRSRFKAALTEARIWVPHIATTQGTLLYLLAMKAKPKVMRYFLQLVESIVNKRITNAVKLDAYLKILEKVEEGYVSFVTLFGKDTGKEDEEDTVIVEKQRRRIFYTIFKYAESEAKEVGRPLTTVGVDLLHSLAARYRPAIGPHIRLLACYIGEGLLTKDVQLEAALIYLSRLDSSYVRLEDLEKYCGLPSSERRRVEQNAKTQS